MIGRTVSHYRITEQLGRGGMGMVYKAQDTRLGRFVALKFLPAELLADPQSRQRFEREGQAASALNHSNICAIYETGQAEGLPFIAMELLEGQSIKDRLETGPFDRNELVEVALQITSALEAVHALGIIHRDIKPANIFLTARGRAKLLDFGLAKLKVEQKPLSAAAATETMATAAMSLHTMPGTAVGTLAYMAPEQVLGEAVDGRADLFSLGVVLHEMATGTLPMSGQLTAVPLPEDLTPIVMRALERNREKRYQSASEMRLDLMRLKNQPQAAESQNLRRSWLSRFRR